MFYQNQQLWAGRHVTSLLLMCAMHLSAAAQAVQTSESQEQRRRARADAAEREGLARAPRVDLQPDVARPALADLPAESPCFRIARFSLDVPAQLPDATRAWGASVLPLDPFRFAQDYLAQYSGACINHVGLNLIVKRLTALMNVLPERLPSKVRRILDCGFNQVGDAIFFRSEFDLDKLPSENYISRVYTDISGYEFAVNKVHLDFYVTSNHLEVGVKFLMEFLVLWKENFSCDVVALVSYASVEGCSQSCTFQFHKRRENIVVMNLDNIEKFFTPALAIDTSRKTAKR